MYRSLCTIGGSFSSKAAMPRATPRAICKRSAKGRLGGDLHQASQEGYIYSKEPCHLDPQKIPFTIVSGHRCVLDYVSTGMDRAPEAT
ncbi:MAG: hypothetical protein FRX49_03555 [Trebouxia sp. A1-2]|nr:MAG: hypothetical protein FRX49_03555 [Trebouxia sp. A1-2]